MKEFMDGATEPSGGLVTQSHVLRSMRLGRMVGAFRLLSPFAHGAQRTVLPNKPLQLTSGGQLGVE
jgi:hypothetical protein